MTEAATSSCACSGEPPQIIITAFTKTVSCGHCGIAMNDEISLETAIERWNLVQHALSRGRYISLLLDAKTSIPPPYPQPFKR